MEVLVFNLKLGRPLLMAVKHSDKLQPFSTNAVGDDERGVGHYEFPSAKNSSGPSHCGLGLKKFDGS